MIVVFHGLFIVIRHLLARLGFVQPPAYPPRRARDKDDSTVMPVTDDGSLDDGVQSLFKDVTFDIIRPCGSEDRSNSVSSNRLLLSDDNTENIDSCSFLCHDKTLEPHNDSGYKTCADLSSSSLDGKRSDLNLFSDDGSCVKEEEVPASKTVEGCDLGDKVGVSFFPPLYVQRYSRVLDILQNCQWKGYLKKAVDFGCAEFRFLHYLKNLPNVQEIALVDVDPVVLETNSHRVNPLNSDFMDRRPNPLVVRVYCGNICTWDKRLKGFDALTAVELIEHLPDDELQAFPEAVFGFIKPKMAVFTTPNADFNVLFPNFSGFRHPDHKFEWTRAEFEAWCNKVVGTYPDYTVCFDGIGNAPSGCTKYGRCSQIAIFTWKPPSTSISPNMSTQSLIDSTSITEEGHKEEKEDRLTDLGSEVYSLVRECDFPYDENPLTEEEKLRGQVLSTMHQTAAFFMTSLRRGENETDEGGCEETPEGDIRIPLSVILSCMPNGCRGLTVQELRKILLDQNQHVVEETNPGGASPIYHLLYGAYASSSSSEDYDFELRETAEGGEQEEEYASQDTYYDNLEECASSIQRFATVPDEALPVLLEDWGEPPDDQDEWEIEYEAPEGEEEGEENQSRPGVGWRRQNRAQVERVQSEPHWPVEPVYDEELIEEAFPRWLLQLLGMNVNDGGDGEGEMIEDDDGDETDDEEDVAHMTDAEDNGAGEEEFQDGEEEFQDAEGEIGGAEDIMIIGEEEEGWMEQQGFGEVDLGASGEPDTF